MRFGRADRADDPFADTGDDGFFTCPTDQLIEIRPHGDAGLDLELNAILGDGVEGRSFGLSARTVDHAGINAGLDRFENVAACQVDGRGAS